MLAALTVPAAVLQSLLVAAMLSPPTFFAGVLATDAIDRWWRPAPDLLDAYENDIGHLAVWIVGINLAGLLILWLPVRWALRTGLAGAALTSSARAPDRTDPLEHRLADVVEELAVAGGTTPPRVVVLAEDGDNLAVFGDPGGTATLVVPRPLLDRLDRRHLSAAVAYQVASTGNGDLRVFNAVLTLPLVWALPRRVMLRPLSRYNLHLWWGLIMCGCGRRTPEQEAWLWTAIIADDIGADDDEPVLVAWIAGITGIGWMMLRILGDMFVVGPLVAGWLHRRRFLADAAAVQLTRDADGYADMLVQLTLAGGGIPGPEAADMSCLLTPRRDRDAGLDPMGVLGGVLHPAVVRRLRRLRRLRAYGHRPPDPRPLEAELFRAEGRDSVITGVHGWRRALWILLFVVVTPPLLALFVLVSGLLIGWTLIFFYILPIGVPVLIAHHFLR